MNDAFWKVGELAKMTGTTVRTLHHYEEVGLLSPSYRSESGHRVYGKKDVIRLQQILFLKQLGFPLEGIRDCLVDKKLGPLEVVRMHRFHIEKERERVSQLYARLTQLENALVTQQGASVEEFLKTIEEIQMHDKYFTKEQLTELENRQNTLGKTKIEQVQNRWTVLIPKVKQEMDKGTDPASEKVQQLAAEWNELMDAFTGGNETIKNSVQNMYQNEPKEQQKMGFDPALFEYVEKMLRAYAEKNK